MATNAAGISKVLYSAGISKSKNYKRSIVSHCTEGYSVSKNWKNEIEVKYLPSSTSSIKQSWLPTRDAALLNIRLVLITKGYEVTNWARR